jgi:hypothetical protein
MVPPVPGLSSQDDGGREVAQAIAAFAPGRHTLALANGEIGAPEGAGPRLVPRRVVEVDARDSAAADLGSHLIVAATGVAGK